MAVTADSVVVELIAKTDQYNAAIRRAGENFTKASGQIGGAASQAEARVLAFQRQVTKSSSQIGNSLKGLAGAFAAAFSIQQGQGLIDTYTRIQNSLKVVGLEGDNLVRVQERLRAIGAQYGADLEGLTQVFNRASLAQKDLGASTEQIIRLNEIIAAGLKVTGTSSQEASGALLQLGQALGSGIVRAEEFNSVLEGALPIAQAAARGIEGFDGSVSKLRTAIADGQITSKQFFDGVLKGGVDTIAQAEKATLTLSGAFTVLRNELALYVGEAAKTNGVTEAISAGIQGLAKNLDTVATAISVIAVLFVGRFAAGIIASTRATIAQTAATAGLARQQAFLNTLIGQTIAQNAVYGSSVVKTTSRLATMGAVSKATGSALLGMGGGLPGIAITALAVAIGYAVSETTEFNDSIREFASGLDDAKGKLEQARARAEGAGVAVNVLKKETDAATVSINGIAGALVDAARQAIAFGNSAKFAAIAAAQLRRVQALETAEKAERVLETRTGIFGDANEFLQTNVQGLESTRMLEAARNNARATVKLVEEELALLAATPEKAFEEVAGGGSAAAGAGKPKKTPKGRKPAEQRMRTQAEQGEELRRLASEELQDRISLTDNVEKRAELQDQLLGIERQSRLAAIANDKSLSDAQRQELSAITNRLYGRDPEGGLLGGIGKPNAIAKELAEAALEQQRRALDDDIATAESNADLLTNRRARVEAESRILDSIERQEAAQLELEIAEGNILDAAKAEANLRQRQSNRREQLARASESPIQRYQRELGEFGGAMGDNFERVAVDGLQAIEDGLTDAIMGTKSLGEAFKGVANQIIADLIRIAVRSTIVNSLAGLFGAGAAGAGVTGIKGALGALKAPGRASGGNVMAGKAYMTGENGRELFVPSQSGKIYPTGALNAAASRGGGGTTVIQNISVDSRNSVTPAGFARQLLTQANGFAANASKTAYDASPARLAKSQALGT